MQQILQQQALQADPVFRIGLVQALQEGFPVYARCEQGRSHAEGCRPDGIGEIIGIRRHAGHKRISGLPSQAGSFPVDGREGHQDMIEQLAGRGNLRFGENQAEGGGVGI